MFLIIYTKYIIKLLFRNKLKVLGIIIVVFLLNLDLKPDYKQYEVVNCINYNNSYYYTIKKDSNLDIISFDEEQLINNSTIQIENNNFTDFVYLISAVIIGILFICVFAGIMDEFDEIFHNRTSMVDTMRELSYTIIENDVSYYMIFDRLINTNQNNYIYSSIPTSINDILNLPKFKTKQQKRENIISLLGL